MKVIIDANVLFRTLISPGTIILLFFDDNLELFAPERLREEFHKNKEEVLQKSTLPEKEFEEFATLLFERITLVFRSEYTKFIPPAQGLLGEHLKDVDFVALSLLKKAKIWTYEKRIFDLGLGITTGEIAQALPSNVNTGNGKISNNNIN